jgi:flagellar biosynthetic protein FliR
MFNLPYQVALEGALVFVRMSGMLFSLPFFGDKSIPVKVRILLAVALSFMVYPLIETFWIDALPQSLMEYATLIGKELFVGLLIGWVAKIAFEGLIAAAQIVGFQMGFGTATLLAPGADQMMDAFTAFHRSLIILFFLALDLHLIYISAIVDTFQAIPAGAAIFRGGLGSFLIEVSASLFLVALQLSASVLVALLFAMSALGLIARTVPQMNVFTMSFPISFFIGILVYIASLSFYPQWLRSHFAVSQDQILQSIRGLMP